MGGDSLQVAHTSSTWSQVRSIHANSGDLVCGGECIPGWHNGEWSLSIKYPQKDGILLDTDKIGTSMPDTSMQRVSWGVSEELCIQSTKGCEGVTVLVLQLTLLTQRGELGDHLSRCWDHLSNIISPVATFHHPVSLPITALNYIWFQSETLNHTVMPYLNLAWQECLPSTEARVCSSKPFRYSSFSFPVLSRKWKLKNDLELGEHNRDLRLPL